MRFLVLLWVGCGGAEAPSSTDDTPETTWPPTKPFQTHGDEGSVLMRSLDWPEGARVDVHAVFARDLLGLEGAAGCVEGMFPCVDPRASFGGDQRATGRNVWRGQLETRWVGDQVSAGPVFAELIHDTEAEAAWYRGSEDQQALEPFRVRFGGEWADFDQTPVLFQEDFRVIEPDLGLGERLLLRGEPIDFRWLSAFDNEVWLWVRGESTQVLYDLDDDGHFRLDPDELGLRGAEVVEVGLAAVDRERIDVDGNDLEVLSLRGAGWKGSRCQDLDVPVEPLAPDGEMEHPLYYDYRFKGVLDDGIRDYRDDAGDPASATLTFTFYGEGIQELCEIVYDASDGGRIRPLIADSGAELYESYQVPLFNGHSTCGLVDPTITGFQDLRNWLEQFDWGFALGEVVELEERLEQAFGPENWAAQEPITYGMFWSKDGLFGDEHNYAYGRRLTACNKTEVFAERQPRPTLGEGLPAGFYETNPYWLFPILR